MNPWRPSLAAKIVLGLLLNLAAVAGVLVLALVLQVRWKPEWLLAGPAGDRLQAAAELIADDLSRSPRTDWGRVLERYSAVHGVEFLLFDGRGDHLAGPDLELPPAIRQRLLIASRGGPGRAGRGPGIGIGPNPRRGIEDGDEDPPHPVAPFRGRLGGGGPQRLRGALFPRSVERAGVPPAYWVILRLPVAEPGRGLALVVRAASLWRGGLFVDVLPWIVAGSGALGLSALFWLPFVRRLTGDIRRLTDRTETIAAGRFDARLDLRRQDELGRLAEAIDHMAMRLADHVAGQRRFLGDAAHELCSPIARMQAALAVLEGLPEGHSPQKYHTDLQEEVDEMSALVNELLAFSRATHGRAVERVAVDLRPLVDRAWAREGRPEIPCHNEVPDGTLAVADPPLLQRAVSNLLRNAVRYAGSAGPITVRSEIQGDLVALHVLDCGPGVAPEALPRLFEPFYRPEASRSREFGGAGLGLAIVKTCLDACQGTVSARNLSPNGFAVTIRLPRGEPRRGPI